MFEAGKDTCRVNVAIKFNESRTDGARFSVVPRA